VIAYDPFLTEKRAMELGSRRWTSKRCWHAPTITLHTPLTEATRNILSRERWRRRERRAHHQLRARRIAR